MKNILQIKEAVQIIGIPPLSEVTGKGRKATDKGFKQTGKSGKVAGKS